VYAAAKRLFDRARSGEGPAFLVCETYRYTGHHVGDINREYYRSKQEEQHWKGERDPIKIFTEWLFENQFADSAQLGGIQAEAKAEMEAAVKFAIDSPYPNADKVEQDVYA
jgi:TPP-dependent pyruvate/acetoin dehydrogenase alpha subunit